MWIQAWEFILTVGVGLVLAGVLHFYQNSIKHLLAEGCWLWVLDFGVWLLIIPLVFAGLLVINQGEVRFYVILALVTGGGLYLIYLKPRFDRPVRVAAWYVMQSLRAALSALFFPWRLIKSRRSRPPEEGGS